MADLGTDPGSCGVCGRSMLAGERTRGYVTGEDERLEVCDLCVVRAESAGWIPAELARPPAPNPGPRGAGPLRRLLDRVQEAAPSRPARRASSESAAEAGAGGRKEPARTARSAGIARPTGERSAARRPRRAAGASDAARERGGEAAPQRPRRRSVPQRPERRIRCAFEGFNASPHRKTVSGLIRSLGGPWVCAVSPDEAPGEVRITVAWELSWYQWEVDLTADALPVRELGRGSELSELGEGDREWNAHAAEDGELRLGLVESAAAR